MTDNNRISQFSAWFLPLIIISKVVRYTIMRAQLVNMSIGWGMLGRMLSGRHASFMVSSFGEMSNAASVATNNAEWMFHNFSFGLVEKIFGGDIFTCYVAFEVLITIVFNFLIFRTVVMFLEEHPHISDGEMLFIILNVAVLNIFCFNLAKEPYQLLFFFLMAWAIKRGEDFRSKSALLIGALVLTVLLSRKYYAMIIMYYVVLCLLLPGFFINGESDSQSRKGMSIGRIVLLFVLFGVFHYFLLSTLSEGAEDTYEELVAANTRMGKANSQILPLFGRGNKVLLSVDYFIKVFRLLFPVEILIKGNITYFIAVFYQFLLWGILIRAFKRRGSDNATQTVALYLYIAFLLCSAAFEPDFGSWMRHQGVAFPVILLMIGGSKEELGEEEQ